MSSPTDTERLRFRTWSLDDVDLALSLWGNAEVMRFIGGPYSREKALARVQREMENLETKQVQYWPIFREETFVGCCGLRPHGEIHALGFHLLPQHWGKGYAPEASCAAIEYAWTQIGAKVLFAGHHPQNEKSRRILESLGFVYWRDEFYEPTGLMHPSYLLQRS
jgi:ribosomal-protein-alanine N-acetyltransferase